MTVYVVFNGSSSSFATSVAFDDATLSSLQNSLVYAATGIQSTPFGSSSFEACYLGGTPFPQDTRAPALYSTVDIRAMALYDASLSSAELDSLYSFVDSLPIPAFDTAGYTSAIPASTITYKPNPALLSTPDFTNYRPKVQIFKYNDLYAYWGRLPSDTDSNPTTINAFFDPAVTSDIPFLGTDVLSLDFRNGFTFLAGIAVGQGAAGTLGTLLSCGDVRGQEDLLIQIVNSGSPVYSTLGFSLGDGAGGFFTAEATVTLQVGNGFNVWQGVVIRVPGIDSSGSADVQIKTDRETVEILSRGNIESYMRKIDRTVCRVGKQPGLEDTALLNSRFTGKILKLFFWDYALTDKELVAVARACDHLVEPVVFNWLEAAKT